MLSLEQAKSVVNYLEQCSEIVIDTETYGLRPFHGSRLFSIILGDTFGNDYYFNFHDYGAGIPCLPRTFIKEIGRLFENPDVLWIGHNIKFDLHMLGLEGLRVPTKLHDTMVTERILDYHLGEKDFSLEKTAERYGFAKRTDLIKEWFSKNPKAIKKTKLWFKKNKVIDKDYSLLPPEIIFTYGVGDIAATRDVYFKQMEKIAEREQYMKEGVLFYDLYKQEMELLSVVQEMEYRGVKCDREYIRDAIAFYKDKKFRLEQMFFEEAGEDYMKSPKQNKKLFEDIKDQWSYGKETAKGKVNPTFDKRALSKMNHPLAKLIVEINQTDTLLKFFGGFEYHLDINDVLHTSFNQHLPVTGRFSSSNPNLQNLKKADEDVTLRDEYNPRNAIIPRPGYKFLAVDYDQMEYKLVIDYANPPELLRLVRDEKMDVHEATGKDAGIVRKKAKGVNFSMLYGAGDSLLAKNLGCSLEEAKELKHKILDAHPRIGGFINAVKTRARNVGYIVNWMGRIYNFASNESYKAVNALIQGGCADATKKAMVTTNTFGRPRGCNLLLQIHDELVYEVPLDISDETVKHIVELMETAYPYKHLPLTASPEVCMANLGEKEKYVFVQS